MVSSVQPGLSFAVVEITGEKCEKCIAESVQVLKCITTFDIKAHVEK